MNGGYNDVACKSEYPIQVTITNRLEREKKDLEVRLKQVTEALDALNANPQVKEVIEKISAITHF